MQNNAQEPLLFFLAYMLAVRSGLAGSEFQSPIVQVTSPLCVTTKVIVLDNIKHILNFTLFNVETQKVYRFYSKRINGNGMTTINIPINDLGIYRISWSCVKDMFLFALNDTVVFVLPVTTSISCTGQYVIPTHFFNYKRIN